MIDSSDEIRFWLALWRTPGIGSIRFRQLLEKTGSPQSLLQQSRTALKTLGLGDNLVEALKNPDWGRVDADLTWAGTPNHTIITWQDSRYPELLKQIPDPSPLLFCTGDTSLLAAPQLAMVGSRNPSLSGTRIAREFARALTESGLTVTSGLALGIDAASHQGAIEAGGHTVAVLGTGPDLIYPARHRQLATAISEQGLLLSEFPPGTPARAGQFPRRNRIISGLSLGTLVVQAAAGSGSLITARLALEQGREVFAIPGSINDPLAKGCNALIRQGAKLVETAQDILEELTHYASPGQKLCETNHESPISVNLEYENLLKCIAYAPTTMDTLVEETGQSVEAISSMLLVLELQGLISSAAGGCYYRIK